MEYIVDWPMLLEFTKALAPPLATVGAVFIVAREARLTFLRQKVADKRFAWHEEMHSIIDELHKAYIRLEIAGRAKENIQGPAHEIGAIGLRFVTIADKSWLYAGPKGFLLVQQLITRLAETRDTEITKGFSQSHVAVVSDLLENASVVLASELRQQMKMEPLDAAEAKRIRRLKTEG
jgi:hypothetical protein